MFNEHYRSIIRFAIGYLKNEQIAEDFVLEAFTVYWENKDDLLPETNAPAYILTIIKKMSESY